MVRTKSTPGKSKNASESWYMGDMDFRPRFKRKLRTRQSISYNVLIPNDVNEKYYIGQIWVGTTNNVVPQVYEKCKVKFLPVEDCLEMTMDNYTIVAKVTNDMGFIKDLVMLKIFASKFGAVEGRVYMKMYVAELPLTKFNSRIGKLIKTVFSLTCDVSVESENIIKKHLSDPKEVMKLYSEIYNLRNRSIPATFTVQYERLKPRLRSYQEDAVRWMLQREQEIENVGRPILHPSYEKISLESNIELYLNKFTGYLLLEPPLIEPLRTGGILADEMGLGKTVEVLACILSNSKMDCSIDVEQHPTVVKQPKKRKMERLDDSDDDFEEDSKRLRYPDNIDDFIRFNGNFPARVQCICGETSERGSVRCSNCAKLQHSHCLGYKRGYGRYICPQCWMDQPLIDSKATLIVCPMTLRKQWLDEICKHVCGDFKILRYEGSSVTPIYPNEFQNYDLVLTTYNILQSEFRLSENGQIPTLRRMPKYSAPGSPISRVKWWRLCLDEAQTVETGHIVSEMANKLVANHRWAVTGTPISKDISDLYALVNYLQFSPYSDVETWNYNLYQPYLSGNKEPLCRFLSKILWRTSKDDVLEQLGIPKQVVEEHFIEFSAVEKYFYKREHELCCTDFLQKLQAFDLNIPLKLLDRSSIKKLLAPLLSLRQACTHPNAVRGRYLATKKKVSSMKDLLQALIVKNTGESEEALRLVISAINGLAGIYLLLQQPEKAVQEYRKVLQLGARFGEEEKEKKLSVDKLQLIHTMHNLAEVLNTNLPIEPTLRDSRLKEDCLELEKQYMERHATQSLVALEEQAKQSGIVGKIREKFIYLRGQWYADMLQWVSDEELLREFMVRLQIVHETHNVDKMMINPTKDRLLYIVTTWDDEIADLRESTLEHIDDLFEVSEDGTNLVVCQRTVKMAADCHLRPQKKLKDKDKKDKDKGKKCPLCLTNELLKLYESKLFSQVKRDQDEMSNKGAWKPTPQELILKALQALGRAENANADLLKDGKTHISLLEAIKREFKEARKLWTYLDQQICAKDELDMCKIRLQLKAPNTEERHKVSRVDNILKQLTYIQENKLETIHMLEEHELDYHRAILIGEEKQNMAKLEKCLGTYSYLETLHRQQYAGQSPDPCPICRGTMHEHWSILPCGHCYCLECTEVLLAQVSGEQITCAICRQKDKISEISYIKFGEVAGDQDELQVKGNYSSKIEAVIKLLMTLRKEDERVKVLIFSTWPSILKFLHVALTTNEVCSEIMTSGSVESTLKKFKDEENNVTALLLPIQLGSKGLNLIEATHVVLVEPLLNPGDELQAVGRVHRIGQTKPTVVHKFVVKNTLEDSIHQAVSSNADIWDKNKITLMQLKKLFVDSPVAEVVSV